MGCYLNLQVTLQFRLLMWKIIEVIMEDFKSYGSTLHYDKSYMRITQLHYDKSYMRITQKLHGTNAQIYIYEEDGKMHLKVGGRNRWLSIEEDNFGFCAFVESHHEEFLGLGVGRHYGEWCGPKINSGEGLEERRLFLFSPPQRYEQITLPPNTAFVPEIYYGPIDSLKIDEAMRLLKENGSFLVPGFMKPEGIVIDVCGIRFKKVFEQEETQWKAKKEVIPKQKVDYNHLCQPKRLEKLLSRDESYLRNYPKSLSAICIAYIDDLVKEEQIVGTLDEVEKTRKDASRYIFNFIKQSRSFT